MSNNAHSVGLEIARVHPQINEAPQAEFSFHPGHQATTEQSFLLLWVTAGPILQLDQPLSYKISSLFYN